MKERQLELEYLIERMPEGILTDQDYSYLCHQMNSAPICTKLHNKYMACPGNGLHDSNMVYYIDNINIITQCLSPSTANTFQDI